MGNTKIPIPTTDKQGASVWQIGRFRYEEYKNNITDNQQPWVLGRVNLATVAKDKIHVLPTTVVAENWRNTKLILPTIN